MPSTGQQTFGDGRMPRHSPETRAARGILTADSLTGAVVPAIQLSTTFARDTDYAARQPYTYARDGGPTTREAERLLQDLEQADRTLLFTSGMSAIAAVLEALPNGARIAVPTRMYHGGTSWVRRLAGMGRISVKCFQPGNVDSLASVLHGDNTQLAWIETPSNPECIVTDIALAAEVAAAAGAMLLVDGTSGPPPTTSALELGAQLSFHSGTKYLNGHSDITAGALSFRGAETVASEIETVRMFHGTVLPGFESWLLMRGMRTLHVRFKKISENAMAIAHALQSHPMVESVLYPGLPTHHGHATAAKQMTSGFGGVVSLKVRGDADAALAVLRRCSLFTPATSLGGTESLIEHRRTIEGPSTGLPENLLRLSIGLEDAEDLIEDLRTALSHAD